MTSIVKILDGAGSDSSRRSGTIRDRYAATFFNTGNIIFYEALRRQIPAAQRVYSWDELDDADVIVLSLANFINPTTDIAYPALALERSRAEKIVLIGCGAQADSFSSFFEIRPDTRRVLDIVSERSKSIGVRGQYTAELLERNGFPNTHVIGCPSLFMYGNSLPQIKGKNVRRASVSITESGDLRPWVKDLFHFAVQNNARFIAQGEPSILGLFEDTAPLRDPDLDFFCNFYRPDDMSAETFRRWLEGNAEIHFDYESWIASLSTCSIQFGSRIHGAVAALMAGCPALMTAHDSRTRELCDFFDIPYILPNEFDRNWSLERIEDRASETNFYAIYGNRLDNYLSFLNENGIDAVSISGTSSPAGGDGGRNALSRSIDGAISIALSTRIRTIRRHLDDAAGIPVVSLDLMSNKIAVVDEEDNHSQDNTGVPIGPLVQEQITVDAVIRDNSESLELTMSIYPGDKSSLSGSDGSDASSVESQARIKVERSLAGLRAALSEYWKRTGSSPNFILGAHTRETRLPTTASETCVFLADRYELVRNLPSEGHVLEVGTQTGLFAKFILDTHPNLRVTAIDIDFSLFHRETLAPYIEAGRLSILEALSWDAVQSVDDESQEWIYIDASHAYEHVKKDLESSRMKVKLGGYIVCNDFTTWSPFEAEPYGVVQAVNEFLTESSFEIAYFAFHPFGYHDIALRRVW